MTEALNWMLEVWNGSIGWPGFDRGSPNGIRIWMGIVFVAVNSVLVSSRPHRLMVVFTRAVDSPIPPDVSRSDGDGNGRRISLGRCLWRKRILAEAFRADPRCSLDCSLIKRRSAGVDLATFSDVESLLMKVTIFFLTLEFPPNP